jgi:hypothetical protein
MHLGPGPILWYGLSYEKGDNMEDSGVDWRIILRWKWDVGTWTGLISLRIATGGGPL